MTKRSKISVLAQCVQVPKLCPNRQSPLPIFMNFPNNASFTHDERFIYRVRGCYSFACQYKLLCLFVVVLSTNHDQTL